MLKRLRITALLYPKLSNPHFLIILPTRPALCHNTPPPPIPPSWSISIHPWVLSPFRALSSSILGVLLDVVWSLSASVNRDWKSLRSGLIKLQTVWASRQFNFLPFHIRGISWKGIISPDMSGLSVLCLADGAPWYRPRFIQYLTPLFHIYKAVNVTFTIHLLQGNLCVTLTDTTVVNYVKFPILWFIKKNPCSVNIYRLLQWHHG